MCCINGGSGGASGGGIHPSIHPSIPGGGVSDVSILRHIHTHTQEHFNITLMGPVRVVPITTRHYFEWARYVCVQCVCVY